MPNSSKRRTGISRQIRIASIGAVAAVALAAAAIGGAASATGKKDGEAAVQSVPEKPTDGSAIIAVKVGGDRTSETAVGSLAGVRLQLHADSKGIGAPLTDSWATCTSDADGDCVFTIPAGSVSKPAKTLWVKQIASQPGSPAAQNYFLNETLKVTSGSGAYQFQTPPIEANKVYQGGKDFMAIATGSTSLGGSYGVWQNSRNNPAADKYCGLKIAMILDLSGSVNSNGGLGSLKKAATDFVDVLTGTPSSVALYTFASDAPRNLDPDGQNHALRNLSTASEAGQVKDNIGAYVANGGTNWDQGIYQVANASEKYDVAIVITDGNPTFYENGKGPGSSTRFAEIETSIFSANALKAKGTRVIAIGVGDGISGAADNLIAVSGRNANSDYYQSDNFTQVGQTLRQLALSQCEGSVTVVKQVVPFDTPEGSIEGAKPAGGWVFDARGDAQVAGIAPATGTTAAGSGAVNFKVSFAAGSTSGAVTITEQSKNGYLLHQAEIGQNAICTDTENNPVPITNVTGGFTVQADRSAVISCAVYNMAPDQGSETETPTPEPTETTAPPSPSPSATATDAAAATDPASGTPAAAATGTLPKTGSPVMWLIVTAVLAMAAGATVIGARRRLNG